MGDTAWRHAYRDRFGEDTDAFDRTRPVAPHDVFDEIVRVARWQRGARIVEIGPGTGQATRPLAQRGVDVLGLEIDARLATRASDNLTSFPNASVMSVSFEAWDPGDATFDGVFACNSFHWIDHAVRFVKTADVLAPDGGLVVMSTPVVVPDGADRFWWDIQDDWAAAGAERLDPATKHPDLAEDLAGPVRASGLFDEPVVLRHRFDVRTTAADYVANLATQTGFKELGDARAGLLELVARRIESRGGAVMVHHLAVVTVAMRA